jgi:hypothetical protein
VCYQAENKVLARIFVLERGQVTAERENNKMLYNM